MHAAGESRASRRSARHRRGPAPQRGDGQPPHQPDQGGADPAPAAAEEAARGRSARHRRLHRAPRWTCARAARPTRACISAWGATAAISRCCCCWICRSPPTTGCRARGTTVLNLAREAAALVAHAMDQLGDDFAIHGFDSNGRHDVEYYRFKDFDDPYGEEAQGAPGRHAGPAVHAHGHGAAPRRPFPAQPARRPQADPAAHRRRAARHRRARQAVPGVRHQARGGGPAPPRASRPSA